MITLSSITNNTGRYADTYRIFLYSCKLCFQCKHYVTSYMHHTGKKESKKEILKKDKKNNVTKNLKLFGNSNPDPPNQLELKDNASTH